ncbi:hypothetical protein ACH0B5_16000 [Ureibacillus sp. 179-F W5.1 NHS]|uniref:Uncharacterized protein n=1 Tax=Lysinibacillus halotolerans TaxID=1368476 RepID=A0A3M8H5I7_9BACI|nr:hypothetical protein [Lysinibacillus halotolerans]RNC97340.1 hypothetical protein EC501_15870 [Lysinibacillus halotolerans]
MTEYNRDELVTILQVLAGITLTVGYAFTINVYNSSVPAFALIGSAVGLAIIIGCWIGLKHLGFMLTMIFTSIVFAIYFNFGAMFS